MGMWTWPGGRGLGGRGWPHGGREEQGAAEPQLPCRERGLLVKELRALRRRPSGTTCSGGMPLSLAERSLRSGAPRLGQPPDAPQLGGGRGEPAPEPSVDGGSQWGGSGLTPDGCLCPQGEAAPEGQAQGPRRRGLSPVATSSMTAVSW